MTESEPIFISNLSNGVSQLRYEWLTDGSFQFTIQEEGLRFVVSRCMVSLVILALSTPNDQLQDLELSKNLTLRVLRALPVTTLEFLHPQGTYRLRFSVRALAELLDILRTSESS